MFTLVARIVRLLSENQEYARMFNVITFTNRAADDIRKRLYREVGMLARDVFVGTFHGFSLKWLRKELPNLTVTSDEMRMLLLKKLFPDKDRKGLSCLNDEIERI